MGWEERRKEILQSENRPTELLVALIKPETNKKKFENILEVLQYRGDEEVLEEAKNLLQDPDPKIRIKGIQF